ncbi:MAG: hypothetical protein ACHQHO_11375 [Solirubrobacterales bacterium]
MKTIRIRTIMFAVVSALALSAIAATAASAAELEQLPGKGTFTVKSESGVFETHSKENVSCKTDSGSGEITGAKTDKSKVTFEGCTGPFGVKCTSSGAKGGNIETEVNSELVWLSKASLKAGEKLTLAKEVTIACSFIKLIVKGSTLCPVEPVNTKTTAFKIICKQSGGKQEFTEYENEKGEKIKAITETNKSGSFEESALASTETLTFGELSEIMAT